MILILTIKDIRRGVDPWKEDMQAFDTNTAHQTLMQADMVFYVRPDGVVLTIKNRWNTTTTLSFEEMREQIRSRLELGDPKEEFPDATV